MYKLSFYKTMTDKSYKKVSGWGELLEAPDGTPIEIGLYKGDAGYWDLTEISTGFKILGGLYKTRENALKEFTPEFLQQIADRMKSKEIRPFINRLADHIMNGGKTA